MKTTSSPASEVKNPKSASKFQTRQVDPSEL
jgi:hypothetical protein